MSILVSAFRSKGWIHIFVVLLFVFTLFTAIWGIDFGRHGDESAFTLPLITESIESGRLLPGRYVYPSMWFHFSVASFIPDTIQYIKNNINFKTVEIPEVLSFRDHLVEVSKTKEYKLQTRSLFSFMGLLTIFWIYIAVFRLRNNWKEALAAAAIFGLSWEVGYHVRWIAPQALTMQFVALTVMCVVFAIKSKRISAALGWLYGSAISAGFAFGSLYNAGLAIIPVIIAGIYISKNIAFTAKYKKFLFIASIPLVFGLIFLISTPGLILDPVRFLGDLRYEFNAYANSGFAYAVSPGPESLSLTLTYLSFVLFSKYTLIALFFFTLALLGIYAFWKESKLIGMILLSYPILHILFLISLKTMYVRNLLPAIPFLAIFAAQGFSWINNRIPSKLLSNLLIFLIIALLLLNAYWLFVSADSIRKNNNTKNVADFAKYVDKNPQKQFLLSEALYKELMEFDDIKRLNVMVGSLELSDLAAFRAFELALDPLQREEVIQRSETNITKEAMHAFETNTVSKEWRKWTANRFNYTERWFGPYEVNFNYYPGWVGNDRIVVMPPSRALDLGIFNEVVQPQ